MCGCIILIGLEMMFARERLVGCLITLGVWLVMGPLHYFGWTLAWLGYLLMLSSLGFMNI
jgi:hypothetical protein